MLLLRRSILRCLLVWFAWFVAAAPAVAATRIYVCAFGQQSVLVIDPQTDQVVDQIPVPGEPSRLAAAPDGSYLLVALFDVDQVVRVNLPSKVIAWTTSFARPGPMAILPDGSKAFVGSGFGPSGNLVSVVDPATGAVTQIITMPNLTEFGGFAPFIHNVNLNPAATKLYVSHSVTTQVVVIDTQTETVLRTFSTPPPYHDQVAFSPDGSIGVATSRGMNCPTNGGFSKFDAVNDTNLVSINLGRGTNGAAVDSSGGFAYIADTCGTRDVLLFDLASNTIVGSIVTGLPNLAEGVLVLQDERKAYVGSTGRIAVLDLDARSLLTTILMPQNFGVGPGSYVAAPAPASNQPPLAEAGGDQSPACSAPGAMAVQLDGSASSDPDGDALAYTWTGPFPEGGGTIHGVTPVVTLPLGTHTIHLTVDDGRGGTATDSVTITIDAVVQGLLSPLTDLVPEGWFVPVPDKALKQGRTVPLKLRLYCGANLLTAADVSGPRIVSIIRGGDPIDLATLDLDAGEANDSGLVFRFSHDLWIYNLRTTDLSPGTYAITIETPGGKRYQGGFVLK